MYDTVAAVLTEVPESVLDRRRWDRSREVVNMATGEVSRTMIANTREGLLLTLHGERAIKAERSLPKAHRGQNIEDLSGPAVSVAIAQVDGEIAETLGTYDLPTFGEWMPVRVDYPRSIQLQDDGAVLRTLEKYAEIAMPYKGRPVVGQSHSVAWSKGDIRVKAYSKFLECQDPRARGVLRVEPGVYRARTFRKLLGRDAGEPVTLLDVVTPALFGMVHEKFASRLRGDVMSAKELQDRDLLGEMLAVWGARRTASLMGWALMMALHGIQSREDFLALNLANIATRYRVLADYRKLRDVLVEKGYELSETGQADDDVEKIVHLIADAGMAA